MSGLAASAAPLGHEPGAGELAEQVLTAARAAGWTVGVAESLTGGLVVAALVEIPGASAVLRGGVVAYATDVKRSALGVDAALLADRGAVDADVARQMAAGARRALGADLGLATTGVAGPDPQDGHPPGDVFVAVSSPAGERGRRLTLAGGRAEVRAAAAREALALALDVLRHGATVKDA